MIFLFSFSIPTISVADVHFTFDGQDVFYLNPGDDFILDAFLFIPGSNLFTDCEGGGSCDKFMYASGGFSSSLNLEFSFEGGVWNNFIFTNGEGAGFEFDGQYDMQVRGTVPANAACGQSFSISVTMSEYQFGTNGGSTDSFVVIRPQLVLAGPGTICTTPSTTFNFIYPVEVSPAYGVSVNPSTGWAININQPSGNFDGSAELTPPANFNGYATITVTHQEIQCGASRQVWVGPASAPNSVSFVQFGNSCDYVAKTVAVNGAAYYQWEWNLVPGNSYPYSLTHPHPNVFGPTAEPNSYLQVRVRTSNVCGTSSWRYKSGYMPPQPI
ncbi:MAG: hypothetical protein SH856_00500 [Flavobacteriales bacterium]|nr:hypothetical protein [Flavobacteriales bacterium]